MNQKCVGKITKIGGILSEVTDALDQLKQAIENENEEDVEQAMDMLPAPRTVNRALDDLANLTQGRPWESKRRRADG